MNSLILEALRLLLVLEVSTHTPALAARVDEQIARIDAALKPPCDPEPERDGDAGRRR